MILKGSQRKWGKRLAQHLLNEKDNEQIELHEIRGVAARSVLGAFLEIEATARSTRCKEPFYSCIFSPPENASVSLDQYERAIEAVEERLGLSGQPRVVILHEKSARRHLHCVWSRIDTEKNRAIQLSFDRKKLRDLSLQLYRDMGLEPPAGYLDRNKRDLRNYDRQIWMQAKRLETDPRDLKALIRDLVLASDSRAAFERNLGPHALFLAKGDRRGHVLVHHSGEVISVSKYSGIKPRDLTARLGPADALLPVHEVQQRVKDIMHAPDKAEIRRKIQEAKTRQQDQLKALRVQIDALKTRHRAERKVLYDRQHDQWKAAELRRAQRLRKGMTGLFDRLSGTRGRLSEMNVRERAAHKITERQEKQALIDRQLEERRGLQRAMTTERQNQKTERQGLREQLAAAARPETREKLKERFKEAARPEMGDPGYAEWREAQREKGRGRGREPG